MHLASRLSNDRYRWLALLGVVLCFAVHTAYYAPFLSDDALISLRYAERFASGHGLTWTDGERVEGYTDLLWILLTAGLHVIGLDLIWAARLLAYSGSVAGIVLVALSPKTWRPEFIRILAGSLPMAACPPVAIWAIGGLEHGLMVGVVIGVLLLIAHATTQERLGRSTWIGCGLLSCLVLLRADGAVLVFGVVLPTCFFFRRPAWFRRCLVWSLVPAAVLLAHHLFRNSYYGQWVPNTALAKVAMNEARILGGLRHVGQGLLAMWPVLLAMLALLGMAVRTMDRGAWMPALSLSVTWILYLALVGGDIFPGWRQLLLGLVPFFFVMAQSAAAATEDAPRDQVQTALLLSSAAAVAGFVTQRADAENQRGKTERWEFAGLSVGPALRQAFGDKKPLLAVDAAGALPYWSKLPSLDMLGLNDAYIPRHPPATFGHGGIGHELGDGQYVLSRKPDLIAFNNAAGSREPLFLSGRQMLRTREFREKYQLIFLQGVGPEPAVGEIYVRSDGRLGFQETERGLEIPGYFLAQGQAPATLGSAGELGVRLEPGGVAELKSLRAPEGNYRIELESSGHPVQAVVRCRHKTMSSSGPATAPEVVHISPGAPLSVVASAEEGEAFVRRLHLVRVSQAPTRRCATGALRTTFHQVARPKAEGTAWNAAGNVVFSKSSLIVSAEAPLRSSWLSLSVDNNDVYQLTFLLEGRAEGSVEVGTKDNGGGLANHVVKVPEDVQTQGFDQIRIQARTGDGSFSLGHLLPTDKAPAAAQPALEKAPSSP